MAKDKLSNFIPISRKIFDHEFWEENRSFSKFESWVDLLQSARYENTLKSEWINGKEVKFGRGQLIASIRFLQKRWNWGSITKVEKFLNVLKNKDMVVLEKGQGLNVITICKYDSYNQLFFDDRTAKGQDRGQQKDETNKDNKEDTLEDIFQEFLKMRIKMKKPATERAEKSLRKSLEELSGGNEEMKIKLIERSIVKNYLEFYPLEAKKQNSLFGQLVEPDENLF